MDTDEPPTFTLAAVMNALDEDDARLWLDQWRSSPRQLRTLMEWDIAVAAKARDLSEPERRREQRRFRDIVAWSDT